MEDLFDRLLYKLNNLIALNMRRLPLRLAALLPILLVPICLLATPQQRVTLQVLNWAAAAELRTELDIVKAFEARHPEVRVQVESIASGYREKVLTRIAAGNPPDVFLLDSVYLPAFLRNKFLVDLMPFVSENQIDLDSYFPNVLSIARVDSALYAIPKDFNSLMVFYNKDLFDQAGLPYPEPGWTWDDFVAICRSLTKDHDNDGRPDQYGTAMDLRFLFWQPWLWINGSDVLDPQGRRGTGYFDSNASVATMTFLADLTRKHRVTPSAQALTRQGMLTSLFFTGRIATMVNGHWMVANMRQYIESGDLRVGAVHIPVPPGGKRQTVMYEAGWCVPRGGEHRALAVKLALFLGGEYAARIRARSGIAIPAIRSVAEAQRAADSWGVEEAFFNEIPYCRQPWGTRVEEFRKIELIAEDAMESAINSAEDVAEIARRAAIAIDRVIQEGERLVAGEAGASGDTLLRSFLIGTLTSVVIVFVVMGLVLRGSQRLRYLTGMKFLLPSLLLLVTFVAMPLIFSLFLSGHQWDLINPAKPFVGLDHYAKLLQDGQFWRSLKNTAFFTLQVPIAMGISLLVAMAMNQKLKGVNFYRTLYFLPSVTSFVAIALVWQWMYHPQFGLANYLLSLMGLGPYPWLTHPDLALISIMIMTIWMSIGYQMIIFLAGLQGIPAHLYESARIDGASVVQRFRHITLPQLLPTTFFVLVTSVIGSFQVFAPVYVMTEGGPARSTDVVMYHIYQNAWEYLRLGEASAMSWILFLIIMAATYLQFRLVGQRVGYH